MKQRWVLQGRVTDFCIHEWIDLKFERRRRDLQLNRVRERAQKLVLKAEYRAVLKREQTTRYTIRHDSAGAKIA